MLSIALLGVAVVIVAEGALSVLGVGVAADALGQHHRRGRADLRDSPHIVLVPTVVIFLTVLALNFLGDVVRARFDVRESALRAPSVPPAVSTLRMTEQSIHAPSGRTLLDADNLANDFTTPIGVVRGPSMACRSPSTGGERLAGGRVGLRQIGVVALVMGLVADPNVTPAAA